VRSLIANTDTYGNLNTDSQAYTYPKTASNSISQADTTG
jgi:hypothetical protein